VHANLAALFKADDKTLRVPFLEKTSAFKKDINTAGTIKYKPTLHQASAMIAMIAMRAHNILESPQTLISESSNQKISKFVDMIDGP